MAAVGDGLESPKTEPIIFIYSKGTGILASTSQTFPSLSECDAIPEDKLESLIAQYVNVDSDFNIAAPEDRSVNVKHIEELSLKSNQSLEQLDIDVDELILENSYIPLNYLETEVTNMKGRTVQIDLDLNDSHEIFNSNKVKPFVSNTLCGLNSFVQSPQDTKKVISPNHDLSYKTMRYSEEDSKIHNEASQHLMLPVAILSNNKNELMDSSKTYSEESSICAVDQLEKMNIENFNGNMKFESEIPLEEIENKLERIAVGNIKSCTDKYTLNRNKRYVRNLNVYEMPFEEVERQLKIFAFGNIESCADKYTLKNNKSSDRNPNLDEDCVKSAYAENIKIDKVKGLPQSNFIEVIQTEPTNAEIPFEEVEKKLKRNTFENIEASAYNDKSNNKNSFDRNTNVDEDVKTAKYEDFIKTVKMKGSTPSNYIRDLHTELKLLTEITSNKSKYMNQNRAKMTFSWEKPEDSISNLKLFEDDPEYNLKSIDDFLKDRSNVEKNCTMELKVVSSQDFENLGNYPLICESDPVLTSASLKKELKSPRCECNKISSGDEFKVAYKTEVQTKGEVCDTKLEQTSVNQVTKNISNSDLSPGHNCIKISATKQEKADNVSVTLGTEVLNTGKKNLQITKEVENIVLKELDNIIVVAESQPKTEEKIEIFDKKQSDQKRNFHDETYFKKSSSFPNKIDQNEISNIKQLKSDNLKTTISSGGTESYALESETSFEKIEKVDNLINENLNSPVSTVNKTFNISSENSTDYEIESETSFEKIEREVENTMNEKLNSPVSTANKPVNGSTKTDSPVRVGDPYSESYSEENCSSEQKRVILDNLEQYILSKTEILRNKNLKANIISDREQQKKEIKDIITKALSKPLEEVIEFETNSYDQSAIRTNLEKNQDVEIKSSKESASPLIVQHNTLDSKSGLTPKTCDEISLDFEDVAMFVGIQNHNNPVNSQFNVDHVKVKECLNAESDNLRKYYSSAEKTLSGKDLVHETSGSELHSIFEEMKMMQRNEIVLRQSSEPQEIDPARKIASHIDKAILYSFVPVTHEPELKLDQTSPAKNNSCKSSCIRDIISLSCKQTGSENIKQQLKMSKATKSSEISLEKQRDPKIYSLFDEIMQQDPSQFPRLKTMDIDQTFDKTEATDMSEKISLEREHIFHGKSDTNCNNCDESSDMELENDQNLELLPVSGTHSNACDDFRKDKHEPSVEESRYFYQNREFQFNQSPLCGSISVFNTMKKIYSYFDVNNYLTEGLGIAAMLFILLTGFMLMLFRWLKKYSHF